MKIRYSIARAVVLMVAIVLIATGSAFAQAPAATTQAPGPKATTGAVVAPTNPNAQGTSFKLNVKFVNPLKVNTIQDAIKLFVNAIVRIAIPIIVIFFIWSGLMFVFARGNPDKIREAKNMFFYTIIGTLLILGAWTITNAIVGTVNSIAN